MVLDKVFFIKKIVPKYYIYRLIVDPYHALSTYSSV